MSTLPTRKTFFAKALAGLAGLGLLGRAHLAAKSVTGATSAAAAQVPYRIETDPRSVAREANSL